jgi:hypothetical protein
MPKRESPMRAKVVGGFHQSQIAPLLSEHRHKLIQILRLGDQQHHSFLQSLREFPFTIGRRNKSRSIRQSRQRVCHCSRACCGDEPVPFDRIANRVGQRSAIHVPLHQKILRAFAYHANAHRFILRTDQQNHRNALRRRVHATKRLDALAIAEIRIEQNDIDRFGRENRGGIAPRRSVNGFDVDPIVPITPRLNFDQDVAKEQHVFGNGFDQ